MSLSFLSLSLSHLVFLPQTPLNNTKHRQTSEKEILRKELAAADEAAAEAGAAANDASAASSSASTTTTATTTGAAAAAAAKARLAAASDEVIYKIDIPANRYDMLCLEGIARALNVFTGRLSPPPRYQVVDAAASGREKVRITTKPEVALVRPFIVATTPLTPPQEPGPEDCCQSGCQECVWEVYYRERRAYEKALAERESGTGTERKKREENEGEGGSGGSDTAAPAPAAAPPSAAAVALDAFAALEARLAKQEAEEKKNKKAATESAL